VKLAELHPQFLKREDSHNWRNVDTIGEADGVEFLCPKCFRARGGSVGTHAMICWSPRVPQDTSPTGGRWELHGTGLADLTLVAGSSSVLIKGGCEAHFFIRNGEIIDA
jgi:hypothetical protein